MLEKNNILLVFPGTGNEKKSDLDLSLGIGYIGAYLKSKNYDVRICDMRITKYSEKMLLDYSPFCVGISVTTHNLEIALKVAKFTKEKLPNCKVIFGGPHPTISPKEIVKNKFIDAVVIGEGEITFLELIDVLKRGGDISKVKGICYREGKKTIITEQRGYIKNLDILPFPTSILNLDDYLLSRFPAIPPSTTMVISRGCIGNCSFCQPTLRKMFGRETRYRSTSNVINEIKFLKKKYDLKTIMFWDDSLTTNKRWVVRFCKKIIKDHIRINFICQGRVSTVDEGMLKLMKKAGFTTIIFGIESGSIRMLGKVLRKGTTPEMNKKAMLLCKKLGIVVLANIMIGNPTETENDIYMTYKLIKECNPELVYANITAPLPGTDMYDFCKNKNLILVKDSEMDRTVHKQKIKSDYLSQTRLMKWKFKMQGFSFLPSKIIEPLYLKITLKRWFYAIKMGCFSSIIINDMRQGVTSEGKKIISLLIPPLTHEMLVFPRRKIKRKRLNET
jgi:radical SAM superfamily enzyme YgiQ (UPF0313 family)